MMRVLLCDRFGKPLLVWQEDIAYQRNNIGFLSPQARGEIDVVLGRSRDVGPSLVPETSQAEGEGREGAEAEASEDQPCQSDPE